MSVVHVHVHVHVHVFFLQRLRFAVCYINFCTYINLVSVEKTLDPKLEFM